MTRYTPQWLQTASYPAGSDRRLITALWPSPNASGCAVSVQSAMNLNVAAGWVAVPSANATGSVLCSSDAVEIVTLDAAPGAGQNRIDLVVCQVASTDIGTAAGDTFSFIKVAGIPGASPAVPATPAGSVALAQVLVIGGSASVVAGNITDLRVLGGTFPPPAWNGYMVAVAPPPVNRSLPLGLLGISRYTGTSGTVGATLTAIPGTAVAVTVAAGRRIKITGTFSIVANAGTAATVAILEGATNLGQSVQASVAAGTWMNMTCIAVLDNPTAGVHTYTLAMSCVSGTINIQSAGAQPTQTIVEDVGPFP